MSFLSTLFSSKPKESINDLLAAGAVIVDVRSKVEFQSGHLKKAINIPLDSLPSSLSKLKVDKPVITCCASGVRSGSAKSLLQSKGYKAVNGGSWVSLRKYEQ